MPPFGVPRAPGNLLSSRSRSISAGADRRPEAIEGARTGLSGATEPAAPCRRHRVRTRVDGGAASVRTRPACPRIEPFSDHRRLRHRQIRADSAAARAARTRGDTAIVYDPRSSTSQFCTPGRGDLILNPLDARSPSWNERRLAAQARHDARHLALSGSVATTRSSLKRRAASLRISSR